GGGPVKQELTVHMDNALLGMLQGSHFGSGGIIFHHGEPWTKLFGPLFVYVNEGPSIDALWADAKERSQAEMAQWPCRWLKIEVLPGRDTDLGELEWQPVKHGRTLWQIGIADRSSHEFKGGDNYRHYGNYLRYPREFPDDVTFVIGKSKESADWNFAQWSWYC